MLRLVGLKRRSLGPSLEAPASSGCLPPGFLHVREREKPQSALSYHYLQSLSDEKRSLTDRRRPVRQYYCATPTPLIPMLQMHPQPSCLSASPSEIRLPDRPAFKSQLPANCESALAWPGVGPQPNVNGAPCGSAAGAVDTSAVGAAKPWPGWPARCRDKGAAR